MKSPGIRRQTIPDATHTAPSQFHFIAGQCSRLVTENPFDLATTNFKKQNRRQKINQQIKTCVSNNHDSSDPVFFLYIVGTPKSQRQLLQTVKEAINMLTYLPQISVQGTGSCQCWSVGVRVIPETSTH
jgi:hypothetical protein